MFKKINVQCCDICETQIDVNRMVFFNGWGYQVSYDDPLAQKHKRISATFDLCGHCEDGLRKKVLSFSKDERDDLLIVAEILTYVANRKT